jgi:hypothetical protein
MTSITNENVNGLTGTTHILVVVVLVFPLLAVGFIDTGMDAPIDVDVDALSLSLGSGNSYCVPTA